MGVHAWLAEALRYPAAGRIETLEAGLLEMPDGAIKRACSKFAGHIQNLSLAEWEELYTHTFDLNPTTAPYVGYQIWGDSYKRGAFMAKINREMQELGVEKDGELPDHLIPILRYLDVTATTKRNPAPELVEILEPAVKKMRKVLHKEEAHNPYLHLLEAASKVSQGEPS